MSLLDSILGMFQPNKKSKKSNSGALCGVGDVIGQIGNAKEQGLNSLENIKDIIPGTKDDEIINNIEDKLNLNPKK